MRLAEWTDVEWSPSDEELTIKCGATEGHWIVDALEKAARNSWDPTTFRELAEKIAAVLPPDERPGIQIVLVPR